MKKGFTLIELLVTITIIITLAAISLPRVNNYGDRVNFSNKSKEIETLLNNASIFARNPEIGTDYYQTESAGGDLVIKRYSGGAGVEVGRVQPFGNQIISAAGNLKCLPPGRECYKEGDAAPLSSRSVSPGGVLFATLSDSNFAPARTANFYVYSNPFQIRVEATAP